MKHAPDAERVLAEADIISHVNHDPEWGSSLVIHTREEAAKRVLDALTAADMTILDGDEVAIMSWLITFQFSVLRQINYGEHDDPADAEMHAKVLALVREMVEGIDELADMLKPLDVRFEDEA